MNEHLPAIHQAPWEAAFARVLTPLERFVRRQSSSSLLLMVCTLLALVLANSPLSEAYLHGLHTPLAIQAGSHRFAMGLLHWVNEALMAFFFLLVGLELKRALVAGELADWRQATLPIVAAVGGMVVPALLYWGLNPAGIAATGWGIPMATDIAFAVGALSLLGSRVPKSLAVFLVALAIVDDLGAVLVIAVFYTGKFNLAALTSAALLTLLLITLNTGGVQRLLPYLLVGLALWCAMLASGLHATLAGVILAFCMPIRPKYNAAHFIQQVQALSQEMHNDLSHHPNILLNDTLRARVAAMERGVELVQAPAQRLEDQLHLPVAFLIIPLFALANAAIPFHGIHFPALLTDTVFWGIGCGLVLGKWLGIAGASWLAVHFGMASLPAGMTLRHIHGLGLLGGIGFTMSIFIADLAFATAPDLLVVAKTGILLASVTAGLLGYAWLRWGCSPRQ